MLCFPNCKINLGLYVTRRRSDGYHDIETVFYPVSAAGNAAPFSSGTPLRDVLEIVPAAQTRLHLSGLAVSGSSADNLVMKAYALLQDRFPDVVQPLDIYLHKVIPMGAGLGGGSADGAFMLRLMNDFFQLGLTNPQLAGLALLLGSDCPFFIHNTPGFATGRGELMTPVSIDLSGFSIQVICPAIHVSTGGAFSRLSPRAAPFNLNMLAELPVNQWKEMISNDFETTVFSLHPELGHIKEQLYEQGAVYASMSGSGSAVYALFEKGRKAVLTTDVPFSSFYTD